MKDFCQQADVIIPNLTEASLLTDSSYLEAGSYDDATIKKPHSGYDSIKDFCVKPQKSSIGGMLYGNQKRSLPEYTHQQGA